LQFSIPSSYVSFPTSITRFPFVPGSQVAFLLSQQNADELTGPANRISWDDGFFDVFPACF
jgi:hypothetical protein